MLRSSQGAARRSNTPFNYPGAARAQTVRTLRRAPHETALSSLVKSVGYQLPEIRDAAGAITGYEPPQLNETVATTIIGISSTHLLKTFISAASYSDKVLMWQTGPQRTDSAGAISLHQPLTQCLAATMSSGAASHRNIRYRDAPGTWKHDWNFYTRRSSPQPHSCCCRTAARPQYLPTQTRALTVGREPIHDAVSVLFAR